MTLPSSNSGSWLASPYLSLPLPFLTAALALVLWLCLTPPDVMHVMREGGPIEGLTEKMYFALAVALWLSPRQAGEWKATLALTILLAACGAREMDLHKAFTGFSVLKVSFYLQERPLGTKLIAFAIVATVALAALYLLKTHGRVLWQRVKVKEPVAFTIAIFFITMVFTKILDRSVNILDQDFGISTSESILALVSAMEETIEMSLPMIAAVARLQYIKVRP